MASRNLEDNLGYLSEEEVNLKEWKGFFSVNEVDNLMAEVDKSPQGLPFHHHATMITSGTLLQIHLAMQSVFKELAHTALSHAPKVEPEFCEKPDNAKYNHTEEDDDPTFIESLKMTTIGSIYILNDVGFILPPNGEKPIKVGTGEGKYVFVFQMLIGEKNLDVGYPAGVTYGILEHPGMDEHGHLKVDGLKGNSMMGAGYLVLSTRTVFVCAFEHKRGSHEYFWDNSIADFLLDTSDIEVPKHGDKYSINHAYSIGWDDAVRSMITRMRNPRMGREGKSYYVACAVAEQHMVNMEGGLMMSPANEIEPNGRLLLIHECWPLGYVTREAKGFATDGYDSILEVQPTSVHSLSPYFGGSMNDVLQLIHLHMTEQAQGIDTRRDKGVVEPDELPWTWQE